MLKRNGLCRKNSKMKLKNAIVYFCLLVTGIVLVHYLVLNVHISTFYVQQQAYLYPANFTISPKCSWDKPGSFDFGDYKPRPFILVARMLSIIYSRYGIMTILREGSFLHTFRRIKADMDMDIYMLVPKNMTLWNAYSKIRSVIARHPEFKSITLENLNVFIAGIFFHKSDSIRISFNGKKIVDVNVLHETFINDPDLQVPCLRQMKCKNFGDLDDSYIKANSHHITTRNLFQSLCRCDYMDSALFCFDLNGGKYLEIRYGENYTQRLPRPEVYQLIYERPHGLWIGILSSFPTLLKFKSKIEGHSNEYNGYIYDQTTQTTKSP